MSYLRTSSGVVHTLGATREHVETIAWFRWAFSEFLRLVLGSRAVASNYKWTTVLMTVDDSVVGPTVHTAPIPFKLVVGINDPAPINVQLSRSAKLFA